MSEEKQGEKDYLHFYRIPSSKTPFEAKHKCLWLEVGLGMRRTTK